MPGVLKIPIGIALIVIGALAIILPIAPLAKIVYPILWWGLILILDQINLWVRKSSPIKDGGFLFWGIIVPLSTIYWLYFELANIYFPQWIYVGVPMNLLLNTLLTFASFATVIPAIIEIFWFFKPSAAENQVKISKKYSLLFIAAGLFMLSIPFWNNNFILNQLIWIAPFFLLLPIAKMPPLNLKFLAAGTIAGIGSGFFWEFLNFWAGGKWEYIILPETFRIFEMPIIGYSGFIPFAFSTIAVYFFAKDYLKPRPSLAIGLYLLAIFFSYLFTVRGI